MLSNLVDIGKVVVKITNNIENEKQEINENIKGNPNMLHTFGTVKCSDAEINHDVQYLLNLIQKSKEPEALIYEIKNIKYTVETNRKLILSDFGKSKIYDQHILPLEPIDYNHIIHINIIKTVNAF